MSSLLLSSVVQTFPTMTSKRPLATKRKSTSKTKSTPRSRRAAVSSTTTSSPAGMKRINTNKKKNKRKPSTPAGKRGATPRQQRRKNSAASVITGTPGKTPGTPTFTSPTTQYLNKITLKPEECVQEMKKGTTMIKFCKVGTAPHYRRFYLSESEQYFNWSSEVKDASVTKILIRDIRNIIHGQETVKFKACDDHLDKIDVSFSLVYGLEEKTLDLVAGSKKDYYIYTEGLNYLIQRAKNGGNPGTFQRKRKKPQNDDFKGVTNEQRYVIMEIFKKYDIHTNDEPRIYNRDLKHVCRDLGLDVSHDELLEITQMLDPKDLGYIDFEDFLVNCVEDVLADTSSFEETLAAFKVLDVHNTGFIMKRDLRQILTHVSPMVHENEIDDMINEIAAFKGYVPYVEFIRKMYDTTQFTIPDNVETTLNPPKTTAFRVGATNAVNP